MKFGEELNAYMEKRRVRQQPDVEKMEELLSKGYLGQSKPIPLTTAPIKFRIVCLKAIRFVTCIWTGR
jgi:hypothetical protein